MFGKLVRSVMSICLGFYFGDFSSTALHVIGILSACKRVSARVLCRISLKFRLVINIYRWYFFETALLTSVENSSYFAGYPESPISIDGLEVLSRRVEDRRIWMHRVAESHFVGVLAGPHLALRKGFRV